MSVYEALEAHIRIRLAEGASNEDILYETDKWYGRGQYRFKESTFEWPFDLIRKDHGGA
jgi:hypothetical protein